MTDVKLIILCLGTILLFLWLVCLVIGESNKSVDKYTNHVLLSGLFVYLVLVVVVAFEVTK